MLNVASNSVILSPIHAVQTLRSIPVYDETPNANIETVIHHAIVYEDIHDLKDICKRVERCGIPGSLYVVVSRLHNDSSYVEIQSGFWEHRETLISAVENFILDNKKEFKVKVTRPMPEMDIVVKPAFLVDKIARYKKFDLNAQAFSEAFVRSVHMFPGCNLIVVNNVIVNFREAFIKDLYNVLLRERGPLSSLDIALRLFDSKVGIYKKSLKDVVGGRRNKDKEKVMHHPLHPNEIFRLSRLIEKTIEQVLGARKEIFIRLPDGRLNAYRNHIGVIRIKLDEDEYLVINMSDEFDVSSNVRRIIEANRPFLSQLIKNFRINVDTEEIESRFYEKLWQAVVQYDEVWGHKFHTFLHRALMNILIDEQTKREKNPLPVSLNMTINDKNNEELGNVYHDKTTDHLFDPAARVHESSLIQMVKKEFNSDEQQVIFLIMDGMKDREIAASLNKSVVEVATIKKSLSSSPQLIEWFARA